MNVNFDGRTYSFEVTPGESGYKLFTEAIRNAFSLPEDSELNITFTCDEPSTAGALLTLQGAGAYDAAVHCASVSAARRIALQPHIVVPAQPSTTTPTPSSSAAAASTTTSPASPHSTAAAPQQQQQQEQQRRPVQPQLSSSTMLAGSKPRRMAVLGRKLRTALCDLLALK